LLTFKCYFIFNCVGDRTQRLARARQVLYPPSHISRKW
jgi:hypothetical protein